LDADRLLLLEVVYHGYQQGFAPSSRISIVPTASQPTMQRVTMFVYPHKMQHFLNAKEARMTDKNDQFWNWFAAQSEAFLHLESHPKPEALLDTLQAQLHRVAPGLTFEFGPPREDPRMLVISADGILELFPAVIELAQAAPALEHWQIQPFRPPQGTDFDIRSEDHMLSPTAIWFRALPDPVMPDKLILELYFKRYAEMDKEFVINASFVLLDTAIGEYMVATRISGISREDLPPNPEQHGLQPFSALPAVVAQIVDSA
jgi:hypothetical protein